MGRELRCSEGGMRIGRVLNLKKKGRGAERYYTVNELNKKGQVKPPAILGLATARAFVGGELCEIKKIETSAKRQSALSQISP